MNPIYISATDTIIRAYGTRYTHPDTGIVYGGTDYDNSAKLAEIGAVPLREVMPAEGNMAEAWEIVDDPENIGGKLRRPTIEVELPPPVPAIPTYSKLKIVETIDDMGRLDEFAGMMAQASTRIQMRWQAANVLEGDDEDLQSFVAMIQTAWELTDALRPLRHGHRRGPYVHPGSRITRTHHGRYQENP